MPPTKLASATTTAMNLTREQILAYRQRVGSLNERLARGPDSLRRAAWAGLTDSMPRAALLSIHARVEETTPETWQDPALVQLWGPRYSAYVVAAADRAVFSLGRMPLGEAQRRRAQTVASQAREYLGDARSSQRASARDVLARQWNPKSPHCRCRGSVATSPSAGTTDR